MNWFSGIAFFCAMLVIYIDNYYLGLTFKIIYVNKKAAAKKDALTSNQVLTESDDFIENEASADEIIIESKKSMSFYKSLLSFYLTVSILAIAAFFIILKKTTDSIGISYFSSYLVFLGLGTMSVVNEKKKRRVKSGKLLIVISIFFLIAVSGAVYAIVSGL